MPQLSRKKEAEQALRGFLHEKKFVYIYSIALPI